MKRILQSQAGFTLIELLIAVMVFAVGMMAVARMMSFSIATDTRAQINTEAELLAMQVMDGLMVAAYNENPALTDPRLIDDDGDGMAGLDASDINGVVPVDMPDEIDPAQSTPMLTVAWNVADDQPTADTKTIRVLILRQTGNNNVTVAYRLDFVRTLMDTL